MTGVRVAWIGHESATSLTESVAHKCSEEGCTQPGEFLHWRYRNADSEQGEHSMIEGHIYCHQHGPEAIRKAHSEPTD